MAFKRMGDKLIGLTVLATVVLFLLSKQSVSQITLQFSQDPLLFLSQLFSLIGAILFSFAFIISARLRITEYLFNGFGDAYQSHHWIGTLGFALLLNHPFFLIIRAFLNQISTLLYIIPTGISSYTYGILAFYALFVLIIVTLYLDFPYNVWKFTHSFMGAVLLLALLHTLTIPSDISRYLPLGLWIKGFLITASLSFIYKELFYRKFSGTYIYKIVKVDTVKTVHSITASPTGKPIPFLPGQYAFIKFLNNKKVSREEHPYSIVEKTANSEVIFSVKESGDYTNKLGDLNPGDLVQITGPFGVVHKNFKKSRDFVFIAGGIGITPFISSIEAVLKTGCNAYMFYSVKNQAEALYDNEIKVLPERYNNMHYQLWVSEIQGWLGVPQIEPIVGSLTDKFYFICGPKAMMDSLSKQLKDKGVKDKNIYMEDFTLR